MSPSSKRASGYSLVEFLVVIAALGMILWIFGQLFFPMQRLATRERLDVEARQTARASIDYLHFMLRGAGDQNSINPARRTPALLLTHVLDDAGNDMQVSYNNVTNANLADIGTDIITFSRSIGAASVPAQSWAGSEVSATASTFYFNEKCTTTGGGSTENFAYFKEITGRHPVSGVDQSELLTVMNPADGNWLFYRITSYDDGTNADCCATTKRWISVIANPAASNHITPVGVTALAFPELVPGVRFYTLRVRNGWLEQKLGVFNPNTDNPGTAFVQILPNVEDLQIVYMFNSQLRNNLSTNQLPSGQQGVPVQGTGGLGTQDVWAVRVTVTVRSSATVPGGLNKDNIQPVAEDHDPKTDTPAKVKDDFYHVQLSGIAVFRNRALGS